MFNNSAFMLYAMETEGELDTRRGKIRKCIKELKKYSDPMSVLHEVCHEVGISWYALSWEEQQEISNEVDF